MKQGQSEWPIPFSDRAPIIDILPVKKSPATVLELPVKEEGSDEDMPEASWWDRSPLFLTSCRQLCVVKHHLGSNRSVRLLTKYVATSLTWWHFIPSQACEGLRISYNDERQVP